MGVLGQKKNSVVVKTISLFILQAFVITSVVPAYAFTKARVVDNSYLSPKVNFVNGTVQDAFLSTTVTELENIGKDYIYENSKYEQSESSAIELLKKIEGNDFFRKNINELLVKVLKDDKHIHHKIVKNMLNVMFNYYSFIKDDYMKWNENKGLLKEYLLVENGITFSEIPAVISILNENGIIDNNFKLSADFSALTSDQKAKIDAVTNSKSENVVKILDYLKEHMAEEIKREMEEDILPYLISALTDIAKNDFIRPDMIDLKNSLYQGTPFVDKKYSALKEKATGHKATARYWPMKGDPWQWGHIWVALKIISEGTDKLYIMNDDGDPTRKPNLSPLNYRDMMSQDLIKAMAGYVDMIYFNRENEELLTADGDTVTATFIRENYSVLDSVEIEYIAGYDHFGSFVVDKKGEWQLDVPSKLLEVLFELFDQGIAPELGAMFSYRDSDSSDAWSVVRQKEIAYQFITEIGVREYVENKISQLMDSGKFDSETKAKLQQILTQFKTKTTAMSLGEDQTSFADNNDKDQISAYIKEWWGKYKLAKSSSKQIDWWLAKLKASVSAERDFGGDIVSKKILPDLVSVINENPEAGTGFYLDALQDLLPSNLKFKVFNQPMDASSSRVRKFGALHLLPGFSIDAASAFEHFAYPGLSSKDTIAADKEISAEVLGKYVIDLEPVLNDQKTRVDIEKLSSILGPIKAMTDFNKLMEYLQARLDNHDGVSGLPALYFNDKTGFDKRLKQIKQLLSNARGTALHAVDGYLSNYLGNKELRDLVLANMPEGTDSEKMFKLIKFINNYLRNTITKERTEEILSAGKKISEGNFVTPVINALRKKYPFLSEDNPIVEDGMNINNNTVYIESAV